MSVFANLMLDQEEEDERDPELIIREKKRRKRERGTADAENDMLFNIDV